MSVRELARFLLKFIVMEHNVRFAIKHSWRASVLVLVLSTLPHLLRAQVFGAPASTVRA